MKHFQKYQTFYEVTLVALICVIGVIVRATTSIMDAQRRADELPFKYWEPFIWEVTSTLMVVALLPVLYCLLNSKYLSWRSIPKTTAVLLFASLAFSILHILGMNLLRQIVYITQGMNYDLGEFWFEFLYEFRKDFVTFFLLLGGLQMYRVMINQLQGEAKLVDGHSSGIVSDSDRILVKKRGKEFVVKISDVEWLESSGNYVNLHIGKSIYPTRSTLAQFVEQVSAKGFCRTHRSYAVNLDLVESIDSDSNGAGVINLKNGKTVSLSRRYYADLKAQLA